MNALEEKMKQKDIDKFREDLITWFEREQRILPWRENQDPYRVWVSEVMLQQTRVDTVIPYFRRFVEQFPTVSALAEADEEKVLKAWEGLGYYSRVRNLQSAVKKYMSGTGSRPCRGKGIWRTERRRPLYKRRRAQHRIQQTDSRRRRQCDACHVENSFHMGRYRKT